MRRDLKAHPLIQTFLISCCLFRFDVDADCDLDSAGRVGDGCGPDELKDTFVERDIDWHDH